MVNKVRRDGILSAVHAVRGRLDQPSSLGYSSAGTVTAVGEGVGDIAVGDRVACAGAGYAVHAEIACIPRLLVAKIPEGLPISFDEAAFTTVGAVALHGIRTAEVKLGDLIAVLGLGLVGQLTAQLLKTAGCRVFGFDIAADRVDLAIRLGIDAGSSIPTEFADLVSQHTRGFGVDAVLITAETPSSEPVNQAAQVARDRAIVVAVGTVGMELERQRYYEKELDFRVSRSYGPGRYDVAFEQKGRDYPIGHVRWTETRNMEAFLQFLAEGKLDLKPLITHRFAIDQAKEAYGLISGATRERSLAVLFTYPESSNLSQRVDLMQREGPQVRAPETSMKVGLLGAGNFATSTLLPALREATGVRLVAVCAATGPHSRHAADKFKFRILHDRRTRRSQQRPGQYRGDRNPPSFARGSGSGGAGSRKSMSSARSRCVLNEGELARIVRAYWSSHSKTPLLMVGFNRRFSPMALRMKEFLAINEPLALHYRVNAGTLPQDHWIHDPEVGGGRIVGEVCHFVDFLSFLAGSSPVEVQGRPLANPGLYSDDNILISIRFENGSEGTIHYLANGDRAFSKERVEVFGGGAVAVLDDFRKLEMTRLGKTSTMSARFRQDKGHRGEWQAFAEALRSGGASPISLESIVSTTLTTFCIQRSRASGQPVIVDTPAFVQAALQNDSQN